MIDCESDILENWRLGRNQRSKLGAIVSDAQTCSLLQVLLDLQKHLLHVIRHLADFGFSLALNPAVRPLSRCQNLLAFARREHQKKTQKIQGIC